MLIILRKLPLRFALGKSGRCFKALCGNFCRIFSC
ncbi:Uncharacterised protein [Vibrio cholerae]|nr:Uncharacterised protein [Vibrio cholerae]